MSGCSSSPRQVCSLVVLQRVGLYWGRRVIQRVRVVRGLSGQRAGVGESPRSTVTEEPAEDTQS